MLVIVEDRDLHALAQLALDIKTIGRFDVFEVDATKCGLQRGDDVHQLVEIVLFIDLDIEHVDAGKLLEQDGLAFHHRFGRQRADIAKAQHRRAIGDHRDQITPAGVLEGIVRVFDDLLTRRSDAWRVGQRQVVLVDQLLGGCDGNLAGRGVLVVVQRGLALRGWLAGFGRRPGCRRGGGGAHRNPYAGAWWQVRDAGCVPAPPSPMDCRPVL